MLVLIYDRTAVEQFGASGTLNLLQLHRTAGCGWLGLVAGSRTNTCILALLVDARAIRRERMAGILMALGGVLYSWMALAWVLKAHMRGMAARLAQMN